MLKYRSIALTCYTFSHDRCRQSPQRGTLDRNRSDSAHDCEQRPVLFVAAGRIAASLDNHCSTSTGNCLCRVRGEEGVRGSATLSWQSAGLDPGCLCHTAICVWHICVQSCAYYATPQRCTRSWAKASRFLAGRYDEPPN